MRCAPHFVLDALFDFPTGDHIGNSSLCGLFVLHIRAFAGVGNVINVYAETEVSWRTFSRFSILLAIRSCDPKSVDELMTLQFEQVSFASEIPRRWPWMKISFSTAAETRLRSGRRGWKIDAGEVAGGLYAPKTGEILYNGCVDRVDRICCGKDRICYAGYQLSQSIRENCCRQSQRRTRMHEFCSRRRRTACFRGGRGLDTLIGEGVEVSAQSSGFRFTGVVAASAVLCLTSESFAGFADGRGNQPDDSGSGDESGSDHDLIAHRLST